MVKSDTSLASLDASIVVDVGIGRGIDVTERVVVPFIEVVVSTGVGSTGPVVIVGTACGVDVSVLGMEVNTNLVLVASADTLGVAAFVD